MISNKLDYISAIERRQASRLSTLSGYRLDMAERLFDYPEGFLESFLDGLNDEDFIVYPKQSILLELKNQLGKINNVSFENILVDSGSDAIIKNCFHSLISRDESIVVSSPSFPMYKIYSQMFNLKLIEVGFNEEPVLKINNIIDMLDLDTKMIVLANPNSPYGDSQSLKNIYELLETLSKKNIYLLLDEAYIDFGDKSMTHLVKEFDNLIVLKTFSKAWGAAGARIGYCISNYNNIRQIEKVQLTYPVSNTSLKFAIYLCNNKELIDEYAKNTVKERDVLINKLRNCGYQVLDSKNNSIHFHDSSNNQKAITIFDKHKVSYKLGTSASTPLIVPGDDRDDWIRISVGQGILNTAYIQELLEL